MDINKYLNRINFPEDLEVAPTYEVLKQVQYCHITSVPYENIDILEKRAISLEPEDLYDKIVNRNRGGYCFEVNGFLSHMLNRLGFETEDYFARFLRNEQGLPMRRHRIVAAVCEGEKYICDVGIGQSSPRYPLKLVEGLVQQQFGETYKFEKNKYGEWEIYDLYEGQWRIFYSFYEAHQYNVDFYQPSYYFETHPESMFNKTLIVAVKTETGRKTIGDRTFRIFEGDEMVNEEPDMSDERRLEVLKKEFGLEWK